MGRIGYARVSTSDQDLADQVAQLKAASCGIIRSEAVSGASRDGRDELATILTFIGKGDELVVQRIDRLGRSTRDVLNIVHELDAKGASLRVLDPEVTTAGELGRIAITVLGMVAGMELRFIKGRQKAGIEAAKAQCDRRWDFGHEKEQSGNNCRWCRVFAIKAGLGSDAADGGAVDLEETGEFGSTASGPKHVEDFCRLLRQKLEATAAQATLGPRSLQAGVSPLTDHGALELREGAKHLHHHAPGRRHGLDRLGQRPETRFRGLDLLQDEEQVFE